MSQIKFKEIERKEMADWDRAAMIAMWIPKFSKSAPRKFEDYQPLRKSSNSKTDMIALMNSRENNKTKLPKDLPEKEVKAKFDAWVKKTGGDPNVGR